MAAKRFREIGELARLNRLWTRQFFVQLADQPRDGGMLFERFPDFSRVRSLILRKQWKDDQLFLRKVSLQIVSPEVCEPGGGFSKDGLVGARPGLIQVQRLDQRVMMVVGQRVKTLMTFHIFSDDAGLHARRIKRAVPNF